MNPRELHELQLIERVTGARIRPAEVPSVAEAEARDLQVLEERLLDAVGKEGWARYRAVIQDLVADHDPMDLAAAALTLAAAAPRRRASARALQRLPVAPPPAMEPSADQPDRAPALRPKKSRGKPFVFKRNAFKAKAAKRPRSH